MLNTFSLKTCDGDYVLVTECKNDFKIFPALQEWGVWGSLQQAGDRDEGQGDTGQQGQPSLLNQPGHTTYPRHPTTTSTFLRTTVSGPRIINDVWLTKLLKAA